MKIKIAIEKNHLEAIDCRFYGENFQKLIACPDKKTFKNGRFIFLNSFSNIEHILQMFPEADWMSDAADFKYEYLAKKKTEAEMLDDKEKEFIVKDYPDVFKTKPFDHQFKAFEISKDAASYGLFFEQGCGKTKVTIDNTVYLFLKQKIEALIIIAPNGVHKNWITDELPTHCNIAYEAFCWEGNINKKNTEIFENVCNSEKLKVFAFNVECFVSEKQQKILLELLKKYKAMFVVDESQSIKNPAAERTKFLVKAGNVATIAAHNHTVKSNGNGTIAEVIVYKRILSGTPITKGTEDIFSQFQFLDPKILGLSSFYAFKARYCKMGGYLSKQIVGYNHIDEIQDKIKTYTMRVLKKDCLDLPEKLYQKEVFSLTEEQMRVYNDVKNEGLAYVKYCQEHDEPIIYDNIMARMMKMQQIASGYLLNVEEGKFLELVTPEHNPRLKLLKDLLNRIEGKVIIWARFTKDIDYICAILKSQAVRYDGQASLEDKESAKVRFQNDDKIKYFVAKPIKGLTLTAGTTNIYYTNDFDLEKRQQSEDRSHRYGTKEALEKAGLKNILYIDIAASKTIDSKIIRSLRNKKKLADMVLQDPDNLFMENE